MPTTSNFGWTTPADTDLVKDGAAAIRTLANGIDTSFLDLKGGTTGQNLRKASNTDLDFTFAGDATNTVIDAEGDLLVGDSADTLQRLAIGTTGQVLTCDTTLDGKIKWAAASSGVNPQIPRLNANYYVFPRSSATNTTALLDENAYEPVFLPVCTISRISIKTSGSFSGTASIRLGIYNNGANNVPTTVLLDAATVSCTAANTVYEITVNQAITTAGFYWVVSRTATAATTNSFVASSGTAFFTGTSASTTAGFLGVSDRILSFTEGGLTGAFATAGTLVASSGNQPLVGLRIN